MAGFYNSCQVEDSFVILTTVANKSMQPVHGRMPLILELEEIEPWIFDDSETQKLLLKTPCLLGRRAEYEQLSLF